MKILMFSTHSMKYIWYSPQKSKYPLYILYRNLLRLLTHHIEAVNPPYIHELKYMYFNVNFAALANKPETAFLELHRADIVAMPL